MIFDDSFPRRVALARQSIGMTQSELASAVGIVQRQIAAYEGAEARPREKALFNLAAALGTSPEWLSHGAGMGPNIEISKRTVTVREIPLLNNPDYALLLLHGEDAAPISEYIPAPIECGIKAFAVRVRGNSMISNKGISFPDGSIVTFDPDVPAKNGNYVLVMNGSVTSFKKIVTEGDYHILVSLNTEEYPAQQMDSPEIIATAIHVQNNLLSTNKGFDDISGSQSPIYLKSDSFDNKNLSELIELLKETNSLLKNKKPD